MSSNNQGHKEPAVLSAQQPDWLKSIRKEAWDRYNDMPMPDRVPHLWRYTDPALFEYSEKEYKKNGSTSTAIPEIMQKQLDNNAVSGIVLNNEGNGISVKLSPELIKAGVTAGDLNLIVQDNSKLTESRLSCLVGPDFGKYEALNTAVWDNGIYIYVPKNVIFDKPIHLNTVMPSDGNFVSRLFVIIDDGASAAIIDEYTCGPTASNGVYSNVVAEAFTGTNARLQYITVQNLNTGSHMYYTHRSRNERDAHTFTGIAAFGGHITKANYGTALEGRGSESQLEGFLLGEKRQHFDHHTVHVHNAANTLSNLNFKVVLKDRSRSAYTGKITIDHEAPYSEAYQENRNLLLSSKCRVESIPELEINQDEVRCSHGAAMGPPDSDQLFYLRSRGIPEHEAIQLIVEGFMDDALQRVPEILRGHLADYINNRLMGGWTFE